MMLNFFNKKQQTKKVQRKRKNFRSFLAAQNTSFNNFNSSFEKINGELKRDYLKIALRARDLAKNNSTVVSFISKMTNLIVADGFKLNCTSYNEDGLSDSYANKAIQDQWYQYGKSYKKFVSADGKCGEVLFDRAIVQTFFTDGQVFIRRIKDDKSPFGVRYQIIDSLMIDTFFNTVADKDGSRVIQGIKVDKYGKQLSFFISENFQDFYTVGSHIEVPSDQMIHLFVPQFAGQVRGYSPLASVILDLNAIAEYEKAEVNAAIIGASFNGFWEEKSDGANAFDSFSDQEIDTNGDVATEISQNSIRFCPSGFKFTQANTNHPSQNGRDFVKSVLKSVAGALNISYNRLASDYESTSYSSLRASYIDDSSTVYSWQQYFIENWKDLQYAEFLKYILLNDLVNLPFSKIDKFLSHDFKGKRMEFIDPAKELQSTAMRLQLGLSSPIEEIMQDGKDPIDVLNSIKKYEELLKDRGLSFQDGKIALINQNAENKNEDNENE